ncbi:MAG: Asp-tRNA(Asn)/Glu-tRNA(Gln) amidotransferase subunit GatB [Thermotogae bacterium]|nr:Asp-tRNA(Asn)/Glu-tRNA(Gln) amidotransferase subunit GatB [Thermotogota bacterium]
MANEYEIVIGLEIHAQLLTRTKMFCGCSTEYAFNEPNTNVCPVCMGMPGALPITNEEAIRFGVKAALAINCHVNLYSRFDRKNYFYPDLPKGYQITQYKYPLAEHGYLTIETSIGEKKIRIRRLHLEEDAGKLMHQADKIDTAEYSLVDLNRAGVPLAEIVTEPDMSSPQEAKIFMEKLRNILRYTEVCNGNLEEGSLRCDANISLRDPETGNVTPRVEVKNINSFKFVERALEYEASRLKGYFEGDKDVIRETRGWDSKLQKTISQRSKEEENDYRYFPEPDIPPVVLTSEYIENARKELPELPDAKKKRFVQTYNIPEYDASILVSTKELAAFFEECCANYDKPKEVSNWIMTEVLKELKDREIEINDAKVTPKHLIGLLTEIDRGMISKSAAKSVLAKAFETGMMPGEIIEKEGLKQISNTDEIQKIVEKVIEENPKVVAQYKGGKTKAITFFIGQVMKAMRGKANPKIVNQLVKEILDKPK